MAKQSKSATDVNPIGAGTPAPDSVESGIFQTNPPKTRKEELTRFFDTLPHFRENATPFDAVIYAKTIVQVDGDSLIDAMEFVAELFIKAGKPLPNYTISPEDVVTFVYDRPEQTPPAPEPPAPAVPPADLSNLVSLEQMVPMADNGPILLVPLYQANLIGHRKSHYDDEPKMLSYHCGSLTYNGPVTLPEIKALLEQHFDCIGVDLNNINLYALKPEPTEKNVKWYLNNMTPLYLEYEYYTVMIKPIYHL